eukprot:scaffold269_cov404-Prasinococcus_capsulatus_cf.AAC.36
MGTKSSFCLRSVLNRRSCDAPAAALLSEGAPSTVAACAAPGDRLLPREFTRGRRGAHSMHPHAAKEPECPASKPLAAGSARTDVYRLAEINRAGPACTASQCPSPSLARQTARAATPLCPSRDARRLLLADCCCESSRVKRALAAQQPAGDAAASGRNVLYVLQR